MRPVEHTLLIGDQLDRRFAQLRGTVETSKQRSLVELARLFDGAGVRYALIGGVAVQIWSAEPRTTLDIDIAVADYGELPRDALRAAGFLPGERFEHSENWTGPDGAPVRFTDDPAFAGAVARAVPQPLGGPASAPRLRVATVTDLVRAKLRAARDPARRRSKRLMDLADATGLTEQHAATLDELSADERAQLRDAGGAAPAG